MKFSVPPPCTLCLRGVHFSTLIHHDRAAAVAELHRANLMFQTGVLGVGVGASDRSDNEAAIVIYVDKTGDAKSRPQFAESIDGVPVRVVLTDPFVAF